MEDDDDRPVTVRVLREEFRKRDEEQKQFNEEQKKFNEELKKSTEELKKSNEEQKKFNEEIKAFMEMWRKREKEREEKENEHKNRQVERALRVKQTWEAGEYGTMILVFLELHRGSLNSDHRLKVE